MYLLSLCILSFHLYTRVDCVDPQVHTKYGLIKGLKATDGNYSMYLGIPYAKINISNPFGPSIPNPYLGEIFEAKDDSAKCPQMIDDQAVGTLDCLNLNIYVPDSASSTKKLPVLIFIYGGSFVFGSASKDLYGPKFLVRNDIVFITINYRVNIYGFLCLNEPEVPGNQGLRDQLTALRWINENIEYFGGDKSKITLSGQSAGARSVDFQLLSSHQKLFHQIILASGNSMCYPSISKPSSEPLLRLAGYLGLTNQTIKNALALLSNADIKTVTEAHAQVNSALTPCVENYFKGVEKFVRDYTINLPIPNVKNMPILMGFTNKELLRLVKTNPYYVSIFKEYLQNYFNVDQEVLQNMYKRVRKFYIEDKFITETVISKVVDFATDFTYAHPQQRSLYRYLKNGASNIFLYMFSYDGDRNYNKVDTNITAQGAAHADDLGYLFNMAFFNDTPSVKDQMIIDRLTTLWADFVKYGDPTPKATALLPIRWKPVTHDVMNYYGIGENITLGIRPLKQRLSFWDNFFEIYKEFQKGYKPAPRRDNYISNEL